MSKPRIPPMASPIYGRLLQIVKPLSRFFWEGDGENSEFWSMNLSFQPHPIGSQLLVYELLGQGS